MWRVDSLKHFILLNTGCKKLDGIYFRGILESMLNTNLVYGDYLADEIPNGVHDVKLLSGHKAIVYVWNDLHGIRQGLVIDPDETDLILFAEEGMKSRMKL